MSKGVFGIQKKFKFECSHRLYNLCYKSPCSSIHGHSYKVIVDLTIDENDLDKHDMVMDFTDLGLFKEWLDVNFDHALILSKSDPYKDSELFKNQKIYIMDCEYTTAEQMAKLFCDYIKQIIEKLFNFNYQSIAVYVSETENNTAYYKHLNEV